MNFTKQLLGNNAAGSAIVRAFNSLQTQLLELFGNVADVPVRLTNVALVAGSVNLVPTTLQSALVGWRLTRVRAQATIWDTQATNTNASTLALWTSANVSVDVEVF